MQVREIMTANPACCAPEASLQDVAIMMIDADCGEIPVIDRQGKPIGVVTDRDIACRAVAKGIGPREAMARDVMTSPVVTATPDMDLDECCRRMEDYQVRRIPVIDSRGICCGMVAQADVARIASDQETAHVVKDVSRPTGGTQLYPA